MKSPQAFLIFETRSQMYCFDLKRPEIEYKKVVEDSDKFAAVPCHHPPTMRLLSAASGADAYM